jgi:hypothetical protein
MNGTGDINSSMAFGSTSGFIGVRFSSQTPLSRQAAILLLTKGKFIIGKSKSSR